MTKQIQYYAPLLPSKFQNSEILNEALLGKYFISVNKYFLSVVCCAQTVDINLIFQQNPYVRISYKCGNVEASD